MQAAVRMTIVSMMVALGGTIASASPARAQVLGYGIAGPAGYSGFFRGSSAALHAAAGGEVLAAGRVGAGGEFGVLANGSGGLWVTSANAVFQLQPSDPTASAGRVTPFVSGGYTRMSNGDGAFNAWNAGVGADLWLAPRVGLRIDARDHVRPERRGAVHYVAFRAGVVFR